MVVAAAEFAKEIPPPSEGRGVICFAPGTEDYSFNIYPRLRLVHFESTYRPKKIPVVTEDAYFLDYDDVGGPNEFISMFDRGRLTLTVHTKASWTPHKYLARKCRLVPTINFNPSARI